MYVPAVIAVGFYFERWRALATGIGVCGSGIGTFVLAPLVAMMIPTYGWRGTVLILAGDLSHLYYINNCNYSRLTDSNEFLLLCFIIVENKK